MEMNRKKFELELYKIFDEMFNSTENSELYANHIFKNMSDTEFKTWWASIKSGKTSLITVCPNLGKSDMNTERNLKIAKRIGLEFFHRLVIGNPDPDIPTYLTPNKYLVANTFIRVPTQSLMKKLSTTKDSKMTDALTNQLTNNAKSSSLSKVQVDMLTGSGYVESAKELMKVRGGDKGAFLSASHMLENQGKASYKIAALSSTRTGAVKLLKIYQNGKHISTTV